MEDQLRTLAKMQKLDDQIGSFRFLQQQLPQELNEIIEHVELATANLLVSETERAEIAKKQRALEIEIKTHHDQIKKYSGQLAEIKTNKEYKALNSEIAYLKEKISDLESVELELMDNESAAKKVVEENKKELAKAEQAKRDREGELRAKIESLEGDIESLRAERTKLAHNLPPALVKTYGSMIKNRNNLAVVFNVNGACGGCGFVIRPQIRIELQLRKKINFCESCGRIIIEEFEEETPEE